DEQALMKIANAADGSMRDALSLLDQAIAYGHGQVQLADVSAMLGSVSHDDLLPLIEALYQRDGDTLFKALANLSDRAPDFQELLDELITFFHQLAIAQLVPSAQKDTAVMMQAKRFSPEDVQHYYQIALLGQRDIAYTPTPQQGFE